MFFTLLIGIAVALLILGPLIILHEFGHYFAARISGVRPLEYGFGFPPRITGFWTGRTRLKLSSRTQFNLPGAPTAVSQDVESFDPGEMRDLRLTAEGFNPPAASWDDSTTQLADRASNVDGLIALPEPGMKVTVVYSEDDDGTKHALEVNEYERGDEHAAQTSDQVLVGKVRSAGPDELVIKDMLWSLNWLPFGGFVRLRGEENPTARDSLAAKSPGIRAFVLLAGVAVNAMLPFIIFAVASQIPREQVVGDVVVRQVLPDSPAFQAGLRPYYKVIEVDGAEIRTIGDLQGAVTRKLGSETNWKVLRGIPDPFAGPADPSAQYDPNEVITMTMVPRWDPPRHEVVEEVTDPATQMRLAVARSYNSSVGVNDRLTVVEQGSVTDSLREVGVSDVREWVPEATVGDEVRIVASPDATGIPFVVARQLDYRLGAATYLQEGAVGVTLGTESPRVETVSVPLTQAIGDGIGQTFEVLTLARNAIIGAVTSSRNPQFDSPVAVGPVGIGQLSGEVATADIPLASRLTVLLSLTATLSISLAVINFLPIPGLDGGRLLFVLIEVARRGKRIPPEREAIVHLAGFVVLIGLLVVVSFLDISRLFSGESFF